MSEFKRVELTDDDIVGETAKSLTDFILEARKLALKESIEANTVIINKNFAKTNGFNFVIGNRVLYIPPMICGLEIQITDELPLRYDFAVVEAPEAERERIFRKAKAEAAAEIFEEIEKIIDEKYNRFVFKDQPYDSDEEIDAIINYSDVVSDGISELKKKYTEGESNDQQ